MYSGIGGRNGADFVAEFLLNALRVMGHAGVPLGTHGGGQVEEVPGDLDFVICSSGRGLTPKLVDRFRKRTTVVLWTHNDELPDWKAIISRISPLVDIHFSYTKNHGYGDHVLYLPLAADQTVYHPLHSEVDYDFDVAMIGSRRSWRTRFAEGIKKVYSKAFFHFDMNLSHEEVNSIYNRTRVVLAPVQDCDDEKPAAAWGCPCRTFDVPASGAFQIQVNRGGLADVYPDAVVLDPVEDVVQAVERWIEEVDFWLANPGERDRIARKHHSRTIEDHLYQNRIQTMIDEVLLSR